MPKTTDKRKQSLYMPIEMVEELAALGKKLDRSHSWLVQRAWTLAKGKLMAMEPLDAEGSTVTAKDEGEDEAEDLLKAGEG